LEEDSQGILMAVKTGLSITAAHAIEAEIAILNSEMKCAQRTE
jgi:hypothetical protein